MNTSHVYNFASLSKYYDTPNLFIFSNPFGKILIGGVFGFGRNFLGLINFIKIQKRIKIAFFGSPFKKKLRGVS